MLRELMYNNSPEFIETMLDIRAEMPTSGIPRHCSVKFPSGYTPQELIKQKPSVIDKVCSVDLTAFGWFFFPHHINLKYGIPDYHIERNLLISSTHPKIFVFEPRKFSKSTWVEIILTLWHTAYQTKKYIILATESWSFAVDSLMPIKSEMEQNQLLTFFYGNFDPKYRNWDTKKNRWRTDDFVTIHNRIRGLGVGNRVRGQKHDHYVPDLAIVADPESHRNIKTPEQLAKNLKWFNADLTQAVEQPGNVGQIIINGNMVCPGCMIDMVSRGRQWKGKRYSAIKDKIDPVTGENLGVSVNDIYNDDTEPLWKMRFPLSKLRKIKENLEDLDDYDTFPLEFLNLTITDQNKRFDFGDARKWRGKYLAGQDGNYIRLQQTLLPVHSESKNLKDWTAKDERDTIIPVTSYGGGDIGFTDNEKSDWTALRAWCIDRNRDRRFIEGRKFRTEQPSVMCQKICDFMELLNLDYFRIEKNRAELLMEPLMEMVKERGIMTVIQAVEHYTDSKVTRIMWLQNFWHRHKMFINDEHSKNVQLYVSYNGNPQHDDELDADEMANRNMAYEAGSRITIKASEFVQEIVDKVDGVSLPENQHPNQLNENFKVC